MTEQETYLVAKYRESKTYLGWTEYRPPMYPGDYIALADLLLKVLDERVMSR